MITGIFRWPWRALLISAPLIACALLYLPGLSGPMMLDDPVRLGSIMEQRSVGFIQLAREFSRDDNNRLAHPVPNASYSLNAVMDNGSTLPWKAFNLALHLATGLVLTLLAILLAKSPAELKKPWLFGVFIGGLWTIHPLHVSTVLHVTQRDMQFSAFFMAAGLLAYLAGRRHQEEGGSRGWLGVAFALAICYPLALFSKSAAIAFPVLLMLSEWLLLRTGQYTPNSLRAKTIALPALALTISMAAIWPSLSEAVANYGIMNYSPVQFFLTELRIFVFYFVEVLMPTNQFLGIFRDDIPVSKNLLDPLTTLGASLLWLALILTALGLRRRNSLFSFGILFSLTALMTETLLAPQEIILLEQRNYLASFGIVLSLVTLTGKFLLESVARWMVGGVIIAVMGGIVWVKAATWSEENLLFISLSSAHPDSGRLRAIMADRYIKLGLYKEAERTMAPINNTDMALRTLIMECKQHGKLEEFRLTTLRNNFTNNLHPHETEQILRLSNMGLNNKCAFPHEPFLQALTATQAMNMLPTDRKKLLIHKAYYLHEANQIGPAFDTIEEAYRITPRNPIPLFLASEWAIEKGQTGQARQYLERADKVAEATGRDYSRHSQTIWQKLRSHDRDVQ